MADNLKNDKSSLDYLQDKIKETILDNFSKDINSLCLLDTGLGKTRIACEVLKSLFSEIEKNKSYALIFYKQKETVETSWAKELNRFGIKYEILTGKNFKHLILSTCKNKFYPFGAKVYLLSYVFFTSVYHPMTETKNKEKILKADCFSKNPPCLVIFDEIHQVTNSVDNKNKSIRNEIKKLNVKYKIGLTATAAINKTEEIESIEELLNGDDKKLSEQDFIVTDENGTKEKFLGLTAHRYIIDSPLRKDEQEAIKKYNKPNVRNASVVEKILISGRYKGIVLPTPTTKALAIKKIIENLPPSDKIIIIDSYISPLEYLKSQDWIKLLNPCVCHRGEESETKAKEDIKDFNEKPDCRVLLATDKIAGESLNLQSANHLILLGLGWNPARINQILGRINRSKQERSDTFCYILTCNALNDEFINKNDAHRLEVIEQKNKELENFLATNEFDKFERINFSDSESFEKEFSDWQETILSSYIKKRGQKTEDRKRFIQNTIDTIKQDNNERDNKFLCVRAEIYIIYREIYTTAIQLLEDYDLKTEWDKVQNACNKYLSCCEENRFESYKPLDELNILLASISGQKEIPTVAKINNRFLQIKAVQSLTN